MSRRWVCAILMLVFAGATGSGLLATGRKPQVSDAAKSAPGAVAAEAVNRGLARLAKGDQIATEDPKGARKEYQAALEDFRHAATALPHDYRAHAGIGFSLQKLGKYERALESYDRALALAPESSETIERRAQTYLELNRLNDAKHAYMHLFVHDRTASNVLINAMKAWVETRRTHAAGIDPATLEAFAMWVRERDTLASAVVNLGHNSPDWK